MMRKGDGRRRERMSSRPFRCLRFDARKRVWQVDDAMARIAAECLADHLERSRFIIMQRPSAVAPSSTSPPTRPTPEPAPCAATSSFRSPQGFLHSPALTVRDDTDDYRDKSNLDLWLGNAGVIGRPRRWPDWIWTLAGAALLVVLGLVSVRSAGGAVLKA